MAVPSNTFQTYQAIGNREDLSDVIYRIDPTDTPCMTAFEREKASAVNHEWQTQALAAVDTGNAVVEGDDATSDAATPSVRLGNLCQISDKVARVSGTQRAVEVLVFPESMRGTGEGFRPWDYMPNGTMTNATVSELSAAPAAVPGGQKLVLKYKDGEKTVIVPRGTPIVTFKPGQDDQSALVVAGAKVVVTAQMKDGQPTASSLLVGRHGFTPPM